MIRRGAHLGLAALLLAVPRGTAQERGKDEHGPSLPWVRTSGPPGGSIMDLVADRGILYGAGWGGAIRSRDRGIAWERIGPGGPETDCAFAIRMHPSRPGRLFLAFRERPGVYRSTDGGKNWERPLARWRDGERPWGIEIASDDPDTVYALTSAGRVLKSSDGGASWSDPGGTGLSRDRPPLERTLAVPRASDVWIGLGDRERWSLFRSADGAKSWNEVSIPAPPRAFPCGVLADPRDPAAVLVGFADRLLVPRRESLLLRSADRGDSWRAVAMPRESCWVHLLGRSPDGTLYVLGGGVFRSKDEGGSWERVRVPEKLLPFDPKKIAFDARTLYLVIENAGLLASEDGGETWTQRKIGLPTTRVPLIAVDPADPRTLYAVAGDGQGIFRTTDGGGSWDPIDQGGIGHLWGDEICVDPADPRNVWYVTDTGVLHKSEDRGRTWKVLHARAGEFRAASITAIAADGGRLYAAKNGFGIFRTEDGGRSWRFLQDSVDYTYSIAVDPEDSRILYTGHNRKPFEKGARVARSADRGETWRTALEREGSDAFTSVVADPSDPRRLYAASTGPEGVGAALYRSEDRGETWSRWNPFMTFTSIHALAADSSAVYAGVWDGGIFRSADGGRNWRLLKKAPLSAIAIEIHAGTVFAADRLSPRIFVSRDGGETWNVLFDAGSDCSGMTAMALDAGDGSLVVSAVGRDGMRGGIWRIRDGGAARIGGDLPRAAACVAARGDEVHVGLVGGGIRSLRGSTVSLADVRVCDIEMESASVICAATADGLYRSTDSGKTWSRLTDKRTKAVAVRGTRVWAATEEGVFFSDDSGRKWRHLGGPGFADTGAVVPVGDVLYAGTRGGGVFSIANGSWTALGPAVRVVNVQLKAGERTMCASAYPGGFFVSTDRGGSWHERNVASGSLIDLVGRAPRAEGGLDAVTPTDDPDIQRPYPFDVCPANPDYLHLATYEGGLFVSTDGAESWTPVKTLPRDLRIAAVRFDPRESKRVLVASNRGVFVSEDCGVGWAEWNDGLPCFDVYSIAFGPEGRVFAGTRGYGLFSRAAGSSRWAAVEGMDIWGIDWPQWGRPLYQYTTLLVHPRDNRIMYMGTFPSGIFKSVDGGRSWTEKNVGWTHDGVFCLVFHPRDPQVIFAGTYNGINLSTDGGEHWRTWDAGWPAEQWVFSIDFDRTDPRIVYAASKNGANRGRGERGFRGTVMKSTDGGATWFEITRGLDKGNEFHKIIVDRFDPRVLYLGTAWDGVHISRDAGASWEPWNDGLTSRMAGSNGNNVTNVLQLSADGRTLYFGTMGSGVFRTARTGERR